MMRQNVVRAAGARLSALSARRAAMVAVALGALAALAMPPVNLLPVLVVSLSGLALLIGRTRSARGAFAIGWWWGFGHFSAGLYWIANALLTDPARFGWMIPFAVFGLGGVLAFFPAGAAAVARRTGNSPVVRVLALAGAWAVLEWVRGWVFTGFSWNLIATAWLPLLPVAQAASVVGSYGLAIPTVAAAAMPAVLIRPTRRHVAAVAVAWGVIGAIALWGAVRVPAGPAPLHPDMRLRLVQGNVAQTTKWQPELRLPHLLDYVALSSRPGHDGLAAVVWPETAVPFFLDVDTRARELAASAAPPGGVLITGAPRAQFEGNAIRKMWNSLEVITDDARVVAVYDKVHLVPFGEYVPLRKLLPITKITAGGIDFSPGPGFVTLDLPGLPPVSPTICYEDIFPAEVAPAAPRPTWLLNVTNDGWFGDSAGPYQHFAAARMRAIEEGLPMVRAANTGISGFVDPYGRVIAETNLGERTILDGDLPLPLASPPLFARYGNWMILVPLILLGLVGGLYRRLFLANDESADAGHFSVDYPS